jgi:hypothetical protein
MNTMKRLSASLSSMSTSNPKPPTRYQPPFLFRHVTRCRRRNFCHGSHCSIGPGPELGQVQWRDRRYSHWFSKYHGARRRSRWPDLGDPGPCSRREAAVAELKHGMEALAPNPKEQASQVQKVSDQLEMTKPAPQTALTN